jgi:zinc and cadmium transporter
MSVVIYTILSVVIVSLVSLVGVISLFINKKFISRILLLLVSLSAGTLFGGSFLHLLPEAAEQSGFSLNLSLSVLAGIVVFFVLEKLIHLHHHHGSEKVKPVHDKHHIGTMNLAGDALHNFLDGLVIAGSYLVSVPVGVATTVAVVFHEVPQELADFGVLLYSGYSKGKALMMNFFSAAVAIIGAIVGLVLGAKGPHFVQIVLPFAAGGFIYIAGSNLIPELHKHCKFRESLYHLIAMLLGIVIMVGLLFLE